MSISAYYNEISNFNIKLNLFILILFIDITYLLNRSLLYSIYIFLTILLLTHQTSFILLAFNTI